MINLKPMTQNAKADRFGATFCQVNINADLQPKPSYNNNSWFVFGRYNTDGHIINILFHLMGMKVPVLGLVYQSVITVFDETTGEYFAKDHLYPKARAKVAADGFDIRVPNGSMSGDWDNMRVCFSEADISAQLELSAVHYPILIGGTSVIDMCDMCIHEYSVPRLLTKGSLTIKGRKYDLADTGYSWFDRQWQNINYTHSTMKWSWMAISLDCGDIISVFDTNLKGYEGNILSVLLPDGTQTNMSGFPGFAEGEKEYWTSPATKRRYPVSWELDIPGLDAVLRVTPIKKEQEIKSVLPELNKYEGSCTVEGTYKGKPVSGHALVEMIGPWLSK